MLASWNEIENTFSIPIFWKNWCFFFLRSMSLCWSYLDVEFSLKEEGFSFWICSLIDIKLLTFFLFFPLLCCIFQEILLNFRIIGINFFTIFKNLFNYNDFQFSILHIENLCLFSFLIDWSIAKLSQLINLNSWPLNLLFSTYCLHIPDC